MRKMVRKILNNRFGRGSILPLLLVVLYVGTATAAASATMWLSDGYVTPESGEANSQNFSYAVVYWNTENTPPRRIYVYINGNQNEMRKFIPGDADYTDGCVYVKDYVYFPEPSTTNTFYFYADTATSYAQDPLGGGTYSGPIVTGKKDTITYCYDRTTTVNQSVSLEARLADWDGNYLSGKTVKFWVGGSYVGSDSTDSGGYAYKAYTPSNAGSFTILAKFEGDSSYDNSQDSATLSVEPKSDPIPYLDSPSNGSSTTDTTPSFEFHVANDDNDDVSATVFLDDDSDPLSGWIQNKTFPLYNSNPINYSWTPSTLTADTTYYWAVIADDNFSEPQQSAVWSFTVTESFPTHIYVPDDYPTIQQAVDAASSDDTVIVRDGTYTESVEVDKDYLTIRSENGAESTIVQAENSTDHVFEVTANYVTISGFTIRNGDDALYLFLSTNCVIEDNKFMENFDSIYLSRSTNNIFSRNTIVGQVSEVGTAEIIIVGTDKNHYDNVLDTTNMLNGMPIYYYFDEQGKVIDGLQTSFLMLAYSSNMEIKNCNVNTGSGIRIEHSRDNNIHGNISTANYAGILCYLGSTGNNIYDNTFSSNLYGIALSSGSGSNIVHNNVIKLNKWAGISIYGSDANMIYLNDLVDNNANADSENLTNTWSTLEEITYTYSGNTYTSYLGNYWSDYTGSDIDGNGIGDIPYSTDPDHDSYPLMKAFENYIREPAAPPDSIELVSIVPSCGTILQRGTFVDFEVTVAYNLESVDSGDVRSALGLETGECVFTGDAVEVEQGSGTVIIRGSMDVDFLYEIVQAHTVYLQLQLGYWEDPTHHILLVWKHMSDCPYLISLPATGTISGKVTDVLTDEGIAGATVSADGYSTSTDSQGDYSLAVPEGTYTVTASADGYESQTEDGIAVTAGDSVTVDFPLRRFTTETETWAVLIAAADDPTAGNLPSATLNVARLYAALRWAYGIPAPNIKIYVDEIGNEDDNITKKIMRDQVRWLGDRADSNDIAFFYYSGHGGRSSQHEQITPHLVRISDTELRDWFNEDVSAGNTVVMLQSCFSGGFIPELRQDRRWTLAATRADETATDVLLPLLGGSLFSFWLTDAMVRGVLSPDFSYLGVILEDTIDRNLDGNVSLREAFDYAEFNTSSMAAEVLGLGSHPQMDPTIGDLVIPQNIVLRALTFLITCPADMVITDPNGQQISPTANGIGDNAFYWRGDLDVDGDPDGECTILGVPEGDYTIGVVPKEGADAEDTYTIRAIVNGSIFTLARDVKIKDIPSEPYTVGTEAIVSATIDIDPDTLQLGARGKWVTCYLELPEGFDVNAVDVSTLLLNGTVAVQSGPIEVGDYDSDGVADLMVKFDRLSVEQTLNPGEEVQVTVTGMLTGGTLFEGTDTIRVIDKGNKKGEGQIIEVEFTLSQNYPNPFNPETTIEYSLAEGCNVTLKIYNIAGKLIKTLIDEYQTAGSYSVIWYGDNDAGEEAASGVYFFQIKAGDFVARKKMVVLK